jgi:hypothetical protein
MVCCNTATRARQRRSRSLRETANWLLYGGDYSNTRHSPVTDLSSDTLKDLDVVWAFPTGILARLKSAQRFMTVLYTSIRPPAVCLHLTQKRVNSSGAVITRMQKTCGCVVGM